MAARRNPSIVLSGAIDLVTPQGEVIATLSIFDEEGRGVALDFKDGKKLEVKVDSQDIDCERCITARLYDPSDE